MLLRTTQDYSPESIVIPVPESGIFSATGFADHSGLPLYFGIIRDYQTSRTLAHGISALERFEKLSRKLITIPSVIHGKDVFLVDEAVLSGSTLSIAIKQVKEAGAKSISVRIPSPPIIKHCPIHIVPKVDLSYSHGERLCEYEARLSKKFGVNSFKFLSPLGYQKCIRKGLSDKCTECFYADKTC